MRAEMDERVYPLALAQPGVGGDIGMARRAVRVVVARLAIAGRAAIGLQQHQHLATAQHRQAEGVRRLAPRLDKRALQARRQGLAPAIVDGRGNLDVVDVARQQALDVVGLPVAPASIVAFVAQQLQDRGGARGRIKADGIAGAPAARRIVGQHQREAPVAPRCAAEPGPGRRQARHIVDTIGHRLVAQAGELQPRISRCLRLERHGARQQPAIELGQHDIHGEVGGRQATLGVCPRRMRAARQHDLQDGGVGAIEHGRVILGHRREGRGVEDDRGLVRRDQRFQRWPRQPVLQAVQRHAER